MNMMADLAEVKRGAVLNAKMRIAGKEVGGTRVIEVRNPYTNALVGTVPVKLARVTEPADNTKVSPIARVLLTVPPAVNKKMSFATVFPPTKFDSILVSEKGPIGEGLVRE